MKERYPFFRDEEEQSRAVIGESAIEPDLNGHFEKPYAILTQKHLYCKNEQGNFIVPVDQIRSAGQKAASAVPNLEQLGLVLAAFAAVLSVIVLPNISNYWAAKIPFLLGDFAIFGGLSFYWREKRPKIAFALLAAFSIIFYIILLYSLYYISHHFVG